MTWRDIDRTALGSALMPSEEHHTAYHDDAEFHALIRGLMDSLPEVIDYALAKIPERKRERNMLAAALRQAARPGTGETP